MKVSLTKVGNPGEKVWEGDIPKAGGLVLTVRDGPAEAQFRMNGTLLAVEGDGGGQGNPWMVDLQVPRVKEPKE